MTDFFEIAFGALGGGVGIKIIDRIISLKKYNADVRKVDVDTDGAVIAQWKVLYDELKKVQTEQSTKLAEQSVRIGSLELENEKLRLKCINMEQQLAFKDL